MSGSQTYDKHRANSARTSRKKAADGCEIGDIPRCKNRRRRSSCRRNFKKFCQTYFGDKFYFGFGPDHLRLIKQLERAVLSDEGELRALALPRGSGKTTLCELAALWGLLYGHRIFVVVIGADKDHAKEMLKTIKTALEENELIGEDFPEVCKPIRELERTPSRCKKQTCNGVHTRMEYSDEEVVLPTVAKSVCGGSKIVARGILGRIRGLKHAKADGTDIRPDLVIIDDPQTEESSQSPPSIKKRIKVLTGGILGLAGPGKDIAGMMPCTVLEPGDMADQILDRDLYPQWQGERVAFVKKWPKHRELWDKYTEMLREDLKFERGRKRVNDFYRKNRKKMDLGFEVYWDDRKEKHELSAQQNFWNQVVKLGPEKAASELQNDPDCPELIEDTKEFEWWMTAKQVRYKTSGYDWRIVPDEATKLTAMIDVHGDLLYYGVVAWDEKFTGWMIDYGTWPEQRAKYFTKNTAKKTLATIYPETAPAGTSALLHVGLEELADKILKPYQREDGKEQDVDLCMIDANWGPETDTVYDFVSRSPHRRILLPSHGVGIGINKPRIDAAAQKPGEVVGWNWRIPNLRRTKRKVRYITFDSNAWLLFMWKRLQAARGAIGCLELPGDDPNRHEMIADQLRSQKPSSATGNYGERVLFGDPTADNHLLDVMVGCCVAASREGIQHPGVAMHSRGGRNRRKGKRRKLSEM